MGSSRNTSTATQAPRHAHQPTLSSGVAYAGKRVPTLIITLMIGGGDKTQSLARDTVFAAVMITCNGILGLSLLVGTLRRRVAVFNPEGTGAALTTIATIATLSLVLPTFTTSTPGPRYSGAQLTFAAIASLCLYGLFVTVQTVRHREHFLPVGSDGSPQEADEVLGLIKHSGWRVLASEDGPYIDVTMTLPRPLLADEAGRGPRCRTA